MLTQQEMLDKYLPILLTSGGFYQKKVRVFSRPAVIGEFIETITADGKETERLVSDPGLVVVCNHMTGAKEKYVMEKEKFDRRYTFKHNCDQELSEFFGWSMYQAIGTVFGIVYVGEDTQFIASWGEPMVLKNGDMICTPTPDENEIYRIAIREFNETYEAVAIVKIKTPNGPHHEN